MCPDHENPLVVAQHSKLLVERDRSARGRWLELPQER